MSKVRLLGFTWVVLLAGLTVLAVTASQATAVQVQRFYDVKSDFSLQLPWANAIDANVTWCDFEHAWAQQPGFASVAQVSPGGQPAGFDPYSWDEMDRKGKVWNHGVGWWVPVTERQTPYAGPPWPFARNNSVTATSGGNTSHAQASVSINQWNPGGALTGTIRAWGDISAGSGSGWAYAFSESKVTVEAATVDLRSGHVHWKPDFSDRVVGDPSNFPPGHGPRPIDPINVRIYDDEGELLLEDTLLAINAFIDRGEDPEIAWEYGRLKATNIRKGEFHAQVTSAYVPANQRGTADLIIQNGLVVGSSDTGIFDGLLPPVGMPGTFDVSFIYQIELDYNYPLIGQDMIIGMGKGLDCPEPATLSLLALGGLAAVRRRRR